MKKFSSLSLLLASALLTSCSFFSISKDNTAKPAKLTEIKPQFPIKEVWSAHPGHGTGKLFIKLPPATVGNSVYTANANGVVSANDSKTGASRWHTQIRLPITSGPAVGQGIVVVGSAEAYVVALDQNNGKVLWRAPVSNEVLAKPTISEGKVFVKTVDGRLYAFSTRDGHKLWAFYNESPNLILRASSSPKVYDNIVVVGFADGQLMALDSDNGRVIWQMAIATPSGGSPVERMIDIDADPIIADGVVYAASYQGNLVAVTLRQGHVLWRHKISAYTGIAIAGNSLYVSDSMSNVWSFQRSTGQVNWKQKALFARGITEPVVMNNAVVVADSLGYVHWLSREDGHIMNRIYVSKSGVGSPVSVRGNALYVVSNNGTLVNYRA